MFEHIHFFNWKSNFDTKDVLTHKGYPLFKTKYPKLISEINDYHIEGKSRYLLSRPLSQNQQEYLLYMQSFSLMEMEEPYYTKRQNYASLLILFTYEGEGTLIYREKSYTIKAVDIFIIDCRTAHHYRTKNKFWKHSDLHIWGNYAEYIYLELFSQRSPVFHCKQENVFQSQLEKILRLQTSTQKNWAILTSHEIENLLFLLESWTAPSQVQTTIPENIVLLRTYLEHHFQTSFSLDEMAKFSGMSKYHLCREFKKYIGFSPKEYILDLRISQAKFLLQSSSIPSCHIGTIVGFSTEANFIRQFKQNTGMTPGQYRKQFDL